jgi:serine/threonine protein kinase
MERTDITAPGAAYSKGDFIGQKYEVYKILGKGGFGVVYLVYSHETGAVHALKTFQDEFHADQEVRKHFFEEASLWVELEQHPNLVRAYFVDELSGRLYIVMEYIAPNADGLNSLEGYLHKQPPELAQSLRWAIQACHGMEYACSKGVRSHRDLKPANILIDQDGTARITDFGLAGVASETPPVRLDGLGAQGGTSGLSGRTMLGKGFGTPTHMSPEQFADPARCDQRSDIYSFGIVLYQMAAGGELPFLAPLPRDNSEAEETRFLIAMQRLHRASPVPRLDSPLFPILHRCLEKSPAKRYPTFEALRQDLEPLLHHLTGEVIAPPQVKDLEAWEWNNKGSNLEILGRHEEALRCFEKALELDPRLAAGWTNKGNSLHSLGRFEEAVRCLDQALELAPRDAGVWSNKGGSLISLGRFEEAIRCFDQALALDPRDTAAWMNKGGSLHRLHRYEDALRCYDQALELDPLYALAWYNKGLAKDNLDLWQEAAHAYQQFLALAPSDNAQQVEHARQRLRELGG